GRSARSRTTCVIPPPARILSARPFILSRNSAFCKWGASCARVASISWLILSMRGRRSFTRSGASPKTPWPDLRQRSKASCWTTLAASIWAAKKGVNELLVELVGGGGRLHLVEELLFPLGIGDGLLGVPLRACHVFHEQEAVFHQAQKPIRHCKGRGVCQRLLRLGRASIASGIRVPGRWLRRRTKRRERHGGTRGRFRLGLLLCLRQTPGWSLDFRGFRRRVGLDRLRRRQLA